MKELLNLLLQTYNSRPKSMGEAIIIGLASGVLIYGIRAVIRVVSKSREKEKDAKKLK